MQGGSAPVSDVPAAPTADPGAAESALSAAPIRPATGRSARLTSAVRWGAVAAVAVFTFPPVVLPAETTLDASWVLALNFAAARGLVHGRDLVWTFGPLGSAVYPLDIGGNLTWAVPLRLGVMAAWWWAVARLVRRTPGTLAPTVLAAAMIFAASFEQFAVPLLTATVAWLAVALHERRAWPAAVAAALAAIALLMKFNIGLAGAAATATWGILYVAGPAAAPGAAGPGRAARLRAVAAVAAVGALTLGGGWWAAGGPLGVLPMWVVASLRLMRGFESQLVAAGPSSDLAFAFVPLAACLAAALAAAAAARRGGRGRAGTSDLALAAIAALPLFSVFKASFVRQDLHAMQWFLVVPCWIALALPGERSRRGRAVVIGLTALALATGTAWGAVRVPGGMPLPSGLARIADALDLPATRARAAAAAEAARATVMADFGAGFDVPGIVGDAPIDSYPWDLASVLLPGLNWTPRYVLQSYQAYEPTLDRTTAARLEGPAAPRYILYRHMAIDGTQPVTVDPATWRAIWRWYQIEADDGDDTLLLRRRKRPRFGEPRPLPQATAVGRLGEPMDVPLADGKPVLLYADLAPSLAGRLLAAAWRLPPPEIEIERLDGTRDRRRVVWANLPNGILASHMPQWLYEARPLLRTDWTPPPPTVRRVRFVADGRWWRRDFEVRWAVVER